MIRSLAAVVLPLVLSGAAVAQPATGGAAVNMCAGNAVGADGKPLVGDARESFMKKCEAEHRYPTPPDPTPAACEAKARGADGLPLTGAAKDAFVKKCIVDTRAVQ